MHDGFIEQHQTRRRGGGLEGRRREKAARHSRDHESGEGTEMWCRLEGYLQSLQGQFGALSVPGCEICRRTEILVMRLGVVEGQCRQSLHARLA